ncbi:MAG: 5' nucleotidase, NT5C type [Dissulfurimicrobium sp.]|uniref:5' nucleotidase, NT5C type n=1 Tax=Dissulfurimicrobium sp. TaxID=2022436 RepID=UPI003D11E74C
MIRLPKPIAPSEIAFDIDGVIADTMESFLNIARKEFGITHIKKDHITSYWLEDCISIPIHITHAIIDRLVKDPFGTALTPIEGAREALSTLIPHSSLTFVTARPDSGPITEWLHSILPEATRHRLNVIATGEHAKKVDVLKAIGVSYFVEDNLDTCDSLYREGINAIVFDQPWNRGHTPFLRVTSWKEIMEMIKFD